MPSDDLKDYATSDTDFYELLGITFENSQKDLDRAWRKTALKYHPDKVTGDPAAKEIARHKFHLAQVGYDLLSDPTTKALYDNTRAARLQKKRQNELFEGKRRQMKDDLEARERGVKRARTEEEDNEIKLERELRRLAEDGKRLRKEREEALRKVVKQEAEYGGDHPGSPAPSSATPSDGESKAQMQVSEIDRTVKVRWARNSLGEPIGEDYIEKLFSTFGRIEGVHLLNPKPMKFGKKNKKELASICMVQYSSVVGAHAAVEDFPKQTGTEWAVFDSVKWAANKEPDFISSYQNGGSEAGSAPSTPLSNVSKTSRSAFFNLDSNPSTPLPAVNGSGERLHKMPSFSSFSATKSKNPHGSPLGDSLGGGSPSLEEMTMIRLRNAEKKRLADEIRRQDEEAAAAESATS
ncbi:MAG: hypothetical protein Q9191_004719 [Dirinaria sp. TL-2023a]